MFDQQNLVCTNWFEVDCKQSVHFFAQEIGLKEPSKVKSNSKEDTRNRLFGTQGHNNNNNNNNNNNDDDQETNEYEEYEYEGEFSNQGGDFNNQDDGERFLANSPPAPNSGSRGVGGRDRGQVLVS